MLHGVWNAQGGTGVAAQCAGLMLVNVFGA
jgi:hypothetical protein